MNIRACCRRDGSAACVYDESRGTSLEEDFPDTTYAPSQSQYRKETYAQRRPEAHQRKRFYHVPSEDGLLRERWPTSPNEMRGLCVRVVVARSRRNSRHRFALQVTDLCPCCVHLRIRPVCDRCGHRALLDRFSFQCGWRRRCAASMVFPKTVHERPFGDVHLAVLKAKEVRLRPATYPGTRSTSEAALKKSTGPSRSTSSVPPDK